MKINREIILNENDDNAWVKLEVELSLEYSQADERAEERRSGK